MLLPAHKERNPKAKSTREIESGSSLVRKERNPEATSTRVIERGSRKIGDTEEVVVSGTENFATYVWVGFRRLFKALINASCHSRMSELRVFLSVIFTPNLEVYMEEAWE